MKEETKCYCGHTTYCDCGPEEPFKHKVVTIPAEEILANRSNAYEFINFDKQETLEEEAHKILDDYGIKSMGQSIGVLEVKKLMVKIAKWQQEQIGKSEFLKKLRGTKSDAEARRLIFETFKNK